MATAGNGMRPGEYMESSLVKVWPPTVETGGDGFDPDDLGVSAWEERRPEFYVAVTRRSGTTWRTEILRASPIDDGVIPHEVFERLVGQRDRIIAKQRRDRGVEQAAQRNGRQEHGVRVRGKVRENRLRRVAKRRGLILSKSKRRDPQALDYGLYGLFDAQTGNTVGFVINGSPYIMTIEQIAEKQLGVDDD